LQALVALVLVAGFCRGEPGARPVHTFTLDTKQWTDKPKTVHVAGEFNGWNNQATPMVDRLGDGVWQAEIPLDEGSYLYKFVLDANTPSQKWIEDPQADVELREPDGHGGYNSMVVVGPGAVKFADPVPDQINPQAVVFRLNDPTDVNVFEPSRVRLRLRTLAGDVQAVTVVSGSQRSELRRMRVERGLDVWGSVVALSEGAPFHFELRDGTAVGWLNRDGLQQITGDAMRSEEPSGTDFQVPAMGPSDLQTPDWAKRAVWYQIFPERFRNGDASNDPGDFWYENLVPWNGDWWTTLPGEEPGEENFYTGAGNVWKRRYGGDLQGVREKLGYLREMGFNAIYFNPVFEGESMHKYDTADFRHIDDNFGVRDEPDVSKPPGDGRPKTPGNRRFFELDGTPLPEGYVETDDPKTWKWTRSDLLFLDFLREAHAMGFHVIVDGVFNHVGRAHPYFQDVLEKGRNSQYADWFEITDWGKPENWRPLDDPMEVHGTEGGIRWKAWDRADGHLPVFKKDPENGLAPGPYRHIMEITRRWLDPDGDPSTRDGIDGWRLDVPGDIPHPFWIAWRKVVKQANPQAYITGEIWTWANPWINSGDQFDAVMNYQFATACQDFFADVRDAITPTQFNDRLVKLQYNYPFQAAKVMQNLFDSHDTDRAASWFVNPDRPYDGQNRIQDNAKDVGYDPSPPGPEQWRRFLQMVAFQHTFLGAPMTYYGNELGMWSPDDPSNRQPVPWPDRGPYSQTGVGVNEMVREHYRRWIAVRNTLSPLVEGFYAPLAIDDEAGVLVFVRQTPDDVVYVALNRSHQPVTIRMNLRDGRWVNFADPQEADLQAPGHDPHERAVVVPRTGAGHEASNGPISIRLEPFGTAVLGRVR
jgi:glycosidase